MLKKIFLCLLCIGDAYALSFDAVDGFFSVLVPVSQQNKISANKISGHTISFNEISATKTLDQDLISQAYNYILQNKSSLGIANKAELIFAKSSKDGVGNVHLRFNFAYQGLIIDQMQIIVHFNGGQIVRLSGYYQKMSPEIISKINAALNNQGKTLLNARQVLDFISKNLADFKVLSNQAIIVQQSPYVVWRIKLLRDEIAVIYTVSDSLPPKLLTKYSDIKY